jgi:hypothetical protein
MKYFSIFTNYFNIVFGKHCNKPAEMSSTPFQHPEASSPRTESYHMFNVGGDTLSSFLPKQLQKQPQTEDKKQVIDEQPHQDFINAMQMQVLHDK